MVSRAVAERKVLSVRGAALGTGAVSLTARTRVALITPWHPEPVDNGSKQRIAQLIAALAPDYDIVLISLLTADEQAGAPPSSVPGVYRQCVLTLPSYRPRSAKALLAGLHPLPRSFAVTWDRTTAMQLNAIVRSMGIGLALGADLRILHYLLDLPAGIPIVIDEMNTSPFLADEARGGTFARLRAAGRQRKYARFLGQAVRQLDAAVVSSVYEAAAYRQLAGTAQVTLIENGVGAVPESPWHPIDSTQLLYNGALSYAPNAEAVEYFLGDILPLIAPTAPSIHLLVTGKIPSAGHPARAHPQVRLSGWLDRDELDAAYRASRVCIAPLLSGTGTRIKLLEALAYGLPVVTTTKGAEGLDVISGEHLIIADTPAEFAAATVRLLTDDDAARQLGARGREHVRQRYSWDTRGVQLRGLVRDCLNSASTGG